MTAPHQIFAALADPARIAILDALLADGAQTAGTLARGLSLTPPTASRHFGELERVGLIERKAVAQQRIISLKPDAILAVRRWLDRHERFWTESLDRLDAVLKEDTKGDPRHDD
ncbi:ArsR/SmtB family transcription factor [Hyphobacterium marinum]|uniref:Helix-turn-helix domain-containing protein n=1 Tax=Hyphobacterium marinum TaxID=3116574 RepID=A0ABU7LWU2_9PROT|nr:helix-turn-helix domain-containing protein [Hyphobacterium sp. Y6023]MEE2566022.1 helix-turn-helix domain-containing protein [Hyphobacterium sp. Y6023]